MTGATYPSQYNSRTIVPCEGRSLLPALRGTPVPDATLYWEHTGNAAVRRGRWKLVRAHPEVKRYWAGSADPSLRQRLAQEHSYAWELYDLSSDRSEVENVADRHLEIVRELSKEWQAWADRVGVIPFETVLDIYAKRGQPYKDAIG